MKKLVRSSIAPPSVLTKRQSSGKLETAEAIKYFSAKRKPIKSFKYSAYALDEVKAALCKLSSNKCAYCETETKAGHDGDIEHFRPKGEVVQGTVRRSPGYYWLGASWNNLYLSCVHCNQARRQIDPQGKKKTAGKMNQFPLSNPSKRVISHTQRISREERYRLLLDPSKDNPRKHLVFDEKGLVAPTVRSGKKEDPKGRASIDVFALYRADLTSARKTKAVTIMITLKDYDDDLTLFDQIKSDIRATVRKKLLKRLKDKTQMLRAFIRPDEPYSEMGYQIIQKFLSQRNVKF